MIAGATRGAGGAALGAHLARADHNEEVRLGNNRGLTAVGIRDQIDELTRMGSHAKTAQPIYHVHADPPAGRPWSDEERARYWELFEREFGLEGRPFASAIHIKEGREHEHRAYLRIKPDGTAIRLDHDHARREKISRIMEFERGEPLTKGAHNRAVIATLEEERPEIAKAMRAAGLHEGPRPRAATTPKERAQAERTGVRKSDIATATAAAWASSSNGQAFAQALRDGGLRLAQGDNCTLIVDQTGSAHGLQRMLSMHARSIGKASPKSADINQRLDGLDLPSLREVRREILNPGAVGNPDPTLPTPPRSAPVPTKSKPLQASPEASNREGGDSDTPQKLTPAPSLGGSGAGGSSSPSASSPAPSLEPAGDEPGEPPKHGASPQELARYRAKLHAYEELKEKNLQRFMLALAAHEEAKKKGGKQPAPSSSEEARNVGNDWQKSGTTIGQGHEPKQAEHQRLTCGEWLGRGGMSDPEALAVPNDMERRKAENLAISKAVENEQKRIASERAKAPYPDPATRDPDEMERRVRHAAYAPLHLAQEGLRAAIKKLDTTPKAQGFLAWIGWPTAESCARDEAEKAVARARCIVESAKPNRTQLEDARHHARHGAEHAAKQFQRWHQTHGKELDRRESLLLGVQQSLQNGDEKMKATLLGGGMAAALKLEAQREIEAARRREEEQRMKRGDVFPIKRVAGFPVTKIR